MGSGWGRKWSRIESDSRLADIFFSNGQFHNGGFANRRFANIYILFLTNLRRNENVFQQKVFSLFACLLDSLTTWLPFALRARTEIGKCIKPTLGNWTRLLLGLFYSTIDWLTDTRDSSTLVHSWPDLVFSSVGEDWLPTVSWEDSIS